MNRILFIFLLSLLIFSCGKKGETSKAKFKIFSGNLTDSEVQSIFPGGLLVLGRSKDGLQSFTLGYQAGLELNLKKGDWEFATVGWMGANPLEGNQQCSFQHSDIQFDSATISFNMSKQACLALAGDNQNRFTDPLFYDFLSGTYNGFKKLQLKTCPDLLTNCTGAAQVAPFSFNVDIPAMTKGVSLNLLPKGLISNCVSGGTSISNITPPHGGSAGFIGVRVTTFPLPVTSFNNPSGMVQDSSGNIFVLNTSQHNIRKIDTGNIITTFAGPSSGVVFGSIDATGTAARFKNPAGIAIDSSDNIYIADTYNHSIRKVTAAGVVTTFAGSAVSGAGVTDATGSAARFNTPNGVAVDSSGNVYVADTFNHTIRKITSGGVVTTLAGLAGTAGTTDATGASARFNFPSGIAIDPGGAYLYVSDTSNSTIRKIAISGATVTTLAGLAGTAGHVDGTGAAAKFDMPTGLTVDSSANVYVADKNNQVIRMVDSAGVVTTFAGVYANNGSVEGPVATAKFNYPKGIVINASNEIFIADTTNHTIRKITSNVVSTIAGSAGVIGNTDSGSTAGCTGVPKSYMFSHGDGEVMDLPYYVGGILYHQRAAASVDIGAANSDIALSSFYGIITDPAYANLPAISPGAHALYFYNGTTTSGSPLNANQGDFIYYNGSGWTKFVETDSIKLLLQQ